MNVTRIARATSAALALAVAIVAASAAPSTAAIGVTPLSGAVPAGASTASFTVTNPESVERIVQPEVFRWEHVDGKDRLTKSNDWIVNPPVLSIPANGSRVIRMGLKQHGTPAEEVMYRLVLSEVGTHATGGMAVAVNTHLSMPIFVLPASTPSTARKKGEWSAARGAAHQIVVTLKNTGPVHVHVTKFVLRDPSGRTLVTDAPSYVFAGETHSWTLVLDKSAPDPHLLVVEANTDGGVKLVTISDR